MAKERSQEVRWEGGEQSDEGDQEKAEGGQEEPAAGDRGRAGLVDEEDEWEAEERRMEEAARRKEEEEEERGAGCQPGDIRSETQDDGHVQTRDESNEGTEAALQR